MCLPNIFYLCSSKKRLRDVNDKNCDQFRLHNEEKSNVHQSREVNRISKMFVHKSESQRPGSQTKCNGNDLNEIG